MSFAKSISIIGELESEIKTVRDDLALRIDNRLVLETPVDTGEARINWIVSDGAQKTTHLDFGGSAQSAISAAKIEIDAAKAFTYLYIQNNAPHIERLNEGWSQQAPAGFVDTIIAQEVAR